MDSIRESATSAGLTVVGDEVLEPAAADAASVDQSNPDQVQAYEDQLAKVAAWNDLESRARDARDKETRARTDFKDACAKVAAPSVLERVMDAVVNATTIQVNAAGGVLRGAATAAQSMLTSLSQIATLAEGAGLSSAQPLLTYRSKNGVRTHSHAMNSRGLAVGSWNHPFQAANLSNWSAGAGAEGTTGARLAAVVKGASTGLKVVSAGANILAGGIAAYDQWQEDGHNPSIGEEERVARATTSGVTVGGGAALGAWGGAEVGAAFGACVGGPLGAAVGGVLGGVAGGIAGTEAGEWIGDRVNDGIHALTSWW